jgi:hypothetical protein
MGTIGIPALAPNSKLYTLHFTRNVGHVVQGRVMRQRYLPRRGYVYALGHRVYGTVCEIDFTYNPPVYHFTPCGKWAFILAAPNAAAEAAISEVTV